MMHLSSSSSQYPVHSSESESSENYSSQMESAWWIMPLFFSFYMAEWFIKSVIFIVLLNIKLLMQCCIYFYIFLTRNV